MRVEEQYEDVLQNIEFSIINVYRQDPSLLDYDVRDAVEALIRCYEAERSGRQPPALRLHERAQRVFQAAQTMCEFRLGRQQLMTGEAAPEAGHEENREQGLFGKLLKGGFFTRAGREKTARDESVPDIEPISVEEIIKCLKRIQTSIRRWNKQNGRRGYLDFVSEFIL
jgi:hypothetical protein